VLAGMLGGMLGVIIVLVRHFSSLRKNDLQGQFPYVAD